MKKTAKPVSPDSPAQQLAGFLAKLDPKVGKLVRAARSTLRQKFPAAIEQVYDNYNFFVIGFCTTERTSDCMFSLAANAKGVILSFYYGSTLPDPQKILMGSGKQNRFIRLESAAMLARPDVEALLRTAVAQAKSPLRETGGGYLMIKSVSLKQRPRRASSK